LGQCKISALDERKKKDNKMEYIFHF